MTTGIVFRGEIQTYRLPKIEVIQSDSFEIPFDKTLFVEGVRVPVDLLPAAWHFLERWDMAVPLWRYGQTAQDVGTGGEQAETRLIIRDLRVLLHAYEMLFVRRNESGLAFMRSWERECLSGGDKRLAFLRALYHTKPRLCVLPTSWLAEIAGASAHRDGPARNRQRGPTPPLVTLELEPGRLIRCHPGDEEKVLEHFRRQKEVVKRRDGTKQ